MNQWQRPTHQTAASMGRYSLLLAAAAFLLSPGAARPARAEPYMALRQGFVCGDCHTNRTGGGMRNLTVEMHAGKILRLPKDGKGILPPEAERFSPQISRYFSVGGDFRLVDNLLFQDDPNSRGRVKNNTAFRSVQSNDIDLIQGTLYGELRLIPDYLSLYVDERVAPGGAENREAFGLLDNILPWGAYIKAGRFFPAWGLKIQDDTAFVNSASGFSFERNLTGVEIGHSGPGLSWFVSVSEGTEDQDVDQLLTGSAYYTWKDAGPFKGILLGASAAHDAPNDNELNSFTGFGGFSVGPLTLLGQGIFLDTETGSVDVQSWGIYTEANYLINGWMNAKLAFDFLDPSDNQAEDTRNRVSVGIEPFFDRFLQLRLFYRVYNGPEDEPEHNRDELILEGHLFF